MAVTIPESVGALRRTLSGDVITPDQPEYEDARKVWNGDIDRRPAAIARCRTVDDVRAALKFAQKEGLPVAVRAGGHSFPGHSIADGALVIDVRQMNQVTIDADARRATVGGGAVWSEVDGAAVPLGLAVTGGHVTHTGVAGLTLGGGVGHLMRSLGLSSDSLLSAEIVTADGRVLKASETENPDLFWAIRGGGGNFGIATQFVFALHPLPETVFGGLILYAPENGPALIRLYNEVCRGMPDEVTTILGYLHAPPLPAIPESLHFKPVYVVIAVCTDQSVGEKALAPLRTFGPPLFEMLAPLPYFPVVQSLFDAAFPHGTNAYVNGHYFTELSDELATVMHANTGQMPVGRSQMLFLQLGGAVSRVPEDKTAFGGRGAGFLSMYVGVWDEAGDRQPAVAWARAFAGATDQFSLGSTYVNMGDTLSEERLIKTYGEAKYDKLARIKAKYDPDNVFRLNQNIKPRA
ncbi:MAG TPA: FAD-binding oxidoreductase [Candidatus Dormibacteraeota bacterium]|nr:FAD-binding oxidoreductase [Candidatus Dormibacteraeota bacterium]